MATVVTLVESQIIKSKEHLLILKYLYVLYMRAL